MKINILSIGYFKNSNLYLKLYEEYRKRMSWKINLIEIKNFTTGNIEEQKNLEGKELLKKIDNNYKIIVLDTDGKNITTNEFCKICNNFYENFGGINFIIGGSDGLSNEVKNRADYTLSLGKMIFPHLMVRIILIEQLYRVYSINNNHPYHK